MADGSASRTRLKQLDSLRGFAALWVVIFHFSFGTKRWFEADEQTKGAAIAPFLTNLEGLIPVYLFFIISGFVILMTLEQRRNLTDFVVSRFARLFPAYWTCLAITIAAAIAWPMPVQPISPVVVLGNITMLQDFLAIQHIESVYWSLSVELAFYAMMGTIFALGWLDRIEILGSIWLALSVIVFHLFPSLAQMIPWRVLLVTGLQYAPFFFAGILFFRIYRLGATPSRMLLIVACYLTAVANQRWMFVGLIGLIFVLFAIAMWGNIRWLGSPLLVYLGAISYPVYLVHQSVGFRIQRGIVDIGLGAWPGFLIALLAVLVISALINGVIERPVQRAIRTAWQTRFRADRPLATVVSGEPGRPGDTG